MKRLPKWLLLSLLILGAFAAGVHASDGIEKIEAWLRPDFQLELNGDAVVMHDLPILVEGRTYLPVRSLSLLLGADIKWFQHKKLISITTNTNVEQPVEEVKPNQPENGPIIGVITDPGQPNDHETGPIVGVITDPGQPNDRETDQEKPAEQVKEDQKHPDVEQHTETFRFHTILPYEITYQNETYSVLANITPNKIVMLRVSDLIPMQLDLSEVNVTAEEVTGQLFVRFSDIFDQFEEAPLVSLQAGPVVNSVPNDHLQELLLHGEDAHYIRPISGNGTYELMYSTLEGMYYLWHVEVRTIGGRPYLSYKDKIELYDFPN